MYKRNFNEQEIVSEYNAGLSSKKLSEKYSCDVKTIVRLLKRNGVILCHVFHLKLDWAEIYKAYQTGLSVRKLEKIYNCAKLTILRNFYKRGFILRTPREFFLDETKHPNWQGGISKVSKSFKLQIRRLPEYKIWRRNVFIRDDFTCQRCSTKGGSLQAHHKIAFKDILIMNNIKTAEEAIKCDMLWNIDNGVTYCRGCHIRVTWYEDDILLESKTHGEKGDISQKSSGLK